MQGSALRLIVDSAHDGLSSLRGIKACKPHVILSAIDLPLLSGIALLKFVRADRELNSRPFLIYGALADAATALGLGANDWLGPDLSSDQVLAKIYYHIKINKHLIYAQ